jgi:DNA-binding SARP family transcriptional activator
MLEESDAVPAAPRVEVPVDSDPIAVSPSRRLRLLGEFAVSLDAKNLDIAPIGQRVLALLALSDGRLSRTMLAGTIWPDKPQSRASANLRSVLWRFPESIRTNLESGGVRLSLDNEWSVDLIEARRIAAELRGSYAYGPDTVDHFRFDLLTGWDEQWLVVERERFHQIRIHALELLADRQLGDGEPALAAETALLAVSAEPLRESAMALLLRAEVELGNRGPAMDHFRRFEDLLGRALGIAPSRRLRAVLGPVLDRPRLF